MLKCNRMAPAKKMRRLPPPKRALLEPYSPSSDTCIDYPEGLATDGIEPIGPSLSQINVLSGSKTIAPMLSQTNAPHGFEICEASLSETQAPSPQSQTSGADQLSLWRSTDAMSCDEPIEMEASSSVMLRFLGVVLFASESVLQINSGGVLQICDATDGMQQINSGGVLQICGGLLQICHACGGMQQINSGAVLQICLAFF
ncbi:hypothetical protein LOK49_LG15G00841 [Camellia lanceoleosa]|uniref:Uncharacterized protein n=1 Tax=Camellia lanceoleosa TaxID=1840588 RepID=A0ACC0F9K7_9ERIC|nr:hypothetical protein LOK49_LG15G00841 [Camellia lanceoleosa]